MRSVKVERRPAKNPRTKAARKPVRPTRATAAKQPSAFGKREKFRDNVFARTGRRIAALFTRPILLLAASIILLVLVIALFVGGAVGRSVAGIRHGISATIADAGFGIARIGITGNHRTPVNGIVEALGMTQGQSIFDADLPGAYARLSHLPWVASVAVQRRYPDAIFVTLVEKRPFALWQSPRGVVIVERSGRPITSQGYEKFARLPKLIGDGAPDTAADLVEAVAAHRAVAARVAMYERVGGRRWNLILNDGVVVKLPEANWTLELDALEKLIIDDGILERDVTEIDLRSPSHYFFLLRSGEQKDVAKPGKET